MPTAAIRAAVAALAGPGYYPRGFPAVACSFILALAACATTSEIPVSGGTIDPEIEAWVVASSAPAAPRHVVFEWTLREGDARFGGRGAARVAPAYQGRLDLFGPRGEGYLRAVMLGDRLVLPPGVSDAPLPPPALLWSTLGVVRAPADTELVSASGDSTAAELVYARGDDRWRFTIRDGKLIRAEHERPGAGRESVELEHRAGLAVPAKAVYRDWTAFRELVMTVQEVKNVDAFPPETWSLENP